jgi:hypothetical protein
MKRFTNSVFTFTLLATLLLLLSTSYYRPFKSESFVFSDDSPETNIADNSGSDAVHHDADLNVVRDSETLLLSGQTVPPKDYIHLYDSSPYKIVNGHVALKIPCHENSQPKLNVLAGQAPDLKSIALVYIEELSKPGKLCMYHADLEENAPVSHATSEIRIGTITDIAIQNPGITELELPPTTSITIGVNEIGAGAEEHKH